MEVDAPQQDRSESAKVGYKNPPIAAQFKRGVSPNPGGKPKGSRNKLQGDFFRRLADDFERFGIYAIARMRRDDPSTYVRVCASLMPKEFEVVRPLDDFTDDELRSAVETLRAIAAAKQVGSGTEVEGLAEPAQVLQALPEAG